MFLKSESELKFEVRQEILGWVKLLVTLSSSALFGLLFKFGDQGVSGAIQGAAIAFAASVGMLLLAYVAVINHIRHDPPAFDRIGYSVLLGGFGLFILGLGMVAVEVV